MSPNRFQSRVFIVLILCVGQSFFRLAIASAPEIFDLNLCVESALQNNSQIRAAGLTVAESQARIAEVRAGFYPTLNFSASGSQSAWENQAPGTGTSTKENWSSGVSAHYPIFQGFKTVAAIAAANANFAANSAQHQRTRQELVEAVTAAYYRLLQAERLVDVAEQSVQRARLHLDFSNARFGAGLASRSDILKTKVELSDVQLGRIKAQNARLAAQGQLNLQMGRAVHLPLLLVDDLETNPVPGDSLLFFAENQFEKWLQVALKHRPEFEKMQQQIRLQQANRQLARGDYFPKLSLDGSWLYAGESVADLNSSAYFGVSLNFPLFSGFARPARLQQERLALDNLTEQAEGLRQQIALEVWTAHLQVKEAGERVLNSRTFYENALESRNIAEGEYREGVGSMLDVIDAQTALVNSEQTLIEALADYKISLALLNLALGIKNIKELVQ